MVGKRTKNLKGVSVGLSTYERVNNKENLLWFKPMEDKTVERLQRAI